MTQLTTSFYFFSKEPFEIQGDTVCGDCHEGPRRGRLGVPALPLPSDPLKSMPNSSVDRRPFAGLFMCPLGEIGALSVDDFVILVEAGGGIAVHDPSQFPTHTISQVDVKRKKNLRQMILTSPASHKFSLDECKCRSSCTICQFLLVFFSSRNYINFLKVSVK